MIATPLFNGNSKTAQYLGQTAQARVRHFEKSATLTKEPAFNEIISTWQSCKVANWDGEGAEPVQDQTTLNALNLIDALPLGYPLPSVGVEPDGHLTLEWYRHPRWTLSVSISPSGLLYYAALFGSNESKGVERFIGFFPAILLDLIQRVQIS
jgi:hypothetical protein